MATLALVTGTRFVEQLRSTQDVVDVVYQDATRWAQALGPAASNASPIWRDFKRWVNQWGHFAEAQRVPPLLPLPPPLPSVIVRPSAWRALEQWDRQARAWAVRWRQAGASIAELPPSMEPPPEIDTSLLGLDQAKSFGVGVALGLVAGVLIARRLS